MGGPGCTMGEEMYAGFWLGNLNERAHLEDPGVGGRIILRWIIRKWDLGTLSGSIWFSTVTGGGYS